MIGKDSREALADISKRCGLSEEIIKRVQKAETEYVIDGLKRGERVNLPGRGTYRAELRNKLGIGGGMGSVIKPTFTISSKIKDELMGCDKFKEDSSDVEEGLPSGILSLQIPSLV